MVRVRGKREDMARAFIVVSLRRNRQDKVKKKKKSLRLINLKNFSIPWGLRAALVLWCLDQG